MTCLTCRDPRRSQIDAKLLAGIPSGEVAAEYGISKGAMYRHFTRHAGQLRLITDSDPELSAAISELKSHIKDELLGPQALETRYRQLKQIIDGLLNEAIVAKNEKKLNSAWDRALKLFSEQKDITIRLLDFWQEKEEGKNEEKAIAYKAV